MSWFRRVELKPACILSVYSVELRLLFFTCPDLLPLQNQLYLCLQSKNHIAVITHQREQTWRLLSFLRNRRPASLLKIIFLKACSSNNRQSFFHFSWHSLFSSALWRFLFFIKISFNFCTQIVLFTRCEVENCRQGLQNNWLFFCKQLLQLDLTEASKTNPYVQFSVFSNDRLSLIYVMRVQLDNTKQNLYIYAKRASLKNNSCF